MRYFRLFLCLVWACTLLASCGHRYDVYLLIGQSNMAGRGEFAPSDTLPLTGVWLLDDRGEVVPAQEPLNRYSSIRKALSMQGMSLAHSFAETVHERTGRRVLLVMNARGGTSLSAWLPDAPCGRYGTTDGEDAMNRGREMPQFYGEAVRRCRQAMRYGKLKAILWHQGESNSAPEQAAAYLPMLAEFVSALRADLGVGEEVPFIAGEIQTGHPNAPYFNPVIDRVGEVIPNAFCVSAEGLAVKADGLHFTRDAQWELGRRYAATLLDR